MDIGMPLRSSLVGAPGETSHSCRAASSFGLLLIAATERGIGMIEFGN